MMLILYPRKKCLLLSTALPFMSRSLSFAGGETGVGRATCDIGSESEGDVRQVQETAKGIEDRVAFLTGGFQQCCSPLLVHHSLGVGATDLSSVLFDIALVSDDDHRHGLRALHFHHQLTHLSGNVKGVRVVDGVENEEGIAVGNGQTSHHRELVDSRRVEDLQSDSPVDERQFHAVQFIDGLLVVEKKLLLEELLTQTGFP